VGLALYRKYRPRTFTEVIGQEHVTEPLMQALRSGRLHHAYLFSGPRGCGKTSSARILARSLNCVKGPTPEPCGECDSCVALASDGPGSIDVIEIDAASHGGVDDARELRERAWFAPIASRFKVYVIDEAHMVSPQGFNALLKLVEEPPDFVKFIFATTEPEKVLGTIKSRTHHYPFRLIPPSVLRPYLEKLCREEGVSVEPAVFPLVVRAGGGSVRDSLSVLDQLIAGAGVYGVTYARAVSLLGVTDIALIDEMVDALAAGDGAAAFATIDRVADAGHDPRRFTSDLLERMRDLIVLQRVPDATGSGIIEAPEDQLERMTSQAARMGQATLSRMADIAHNGLTEMRGTTAPRLLLELITARMLLPGADDSQGALLQRLERMERRLTVSAEPTEPAREPPPTLDDVPLVRASAQSVAERPAAPAASPPPPPASVAKVGPESHQPAVAAGGTFAPPGSTVDSSRSALGALDAAAVRRVWDEILTTIRRRSPKAWAVVREAMVRDVQGEEIVLVFQHAVHANMFGQQVELLLEALREVLGGTWQVRAELGGDERAASRTQGPTTPMAPPAAEAGRDEGDWPETARPGGGSAPADVGAAPAAAEQPRGGGALAGATAGSPPLTVVQATAHPAEANADSRIGAKTPAAGGNSDGRGAGNRAATSRSGSRGGASRSGKTPTRESGRRGDGGSDGPTVRTDSAAPDGTAQYAGFDPGDEPLDDARPGVRESSDEQAIRAVTEHFAVERIGENNPRA
jgi:DNA polymerase-3 subunit gamma/tau